MSSPHAKSPLIAVPDLDSPLGAVLSAVQAMAEEVARLRDTVARLESAQSTAPHHALLALEGSMLDRLMLMSNTMNVVYGRTALHLKDMAEDTGSDDAVPALLEQLSQLAVPSPKPAERPAARKVKPRRRGG